MACGYCDFENVVAIYQTLFSKAIWIKVSEKKGAPGKLPSPLWHSALSADSAHGVM